MAQPILNTLEELLADAQAEIDDPDTRYKIRTARQLVVILQERQTLHREAIESSELDDQTKAVLLDYIDG